MSHERFARIDGIDMDSGRFGMTLATEGEASDGDILSIKGGQIPDRMPMLVSHFNDPTATAGSVIEAKKHLSDTPPRLTATGVIELGGEGALAEVRRDLAYMIDKGHVEGVSIRWDQIDGKPPIRRINLPSDHPYYVDAETEKSERKRWGHFWPEWRAMEGSIVALGADPKALIGRAEETDGAVRSFWRAMAQDAEAENASGKIAAALAVLRTDVADAIGIGAELADILNAVVDNSDEDIEAVPLGDRTIYLPSSLADQLEAREHTEVGTDLETVPEPAPSMEQLQQKRSLLALETAELLSPANVEALGRMLSDSMDAYVERLSQTVRGILNRRTGKVC